MHRYIEANSGKRNYKHFISFVWVAFLSISLLILQLALVLAKSMSLLIADYGIWNLGVVVVGWIGLGLLAVVDLLLLVLGVFHLFLRMVGDTTKEYLKKKYHNESKENNDCCFQSTVPFVDFSRILTAEESKVLALDK